jgi:hypothetical protein
LLQCIGAIDLHALEDTLQWMLGSSQVGA